MITVIQYLGPGCSEYLELLLEQQDLLELLLEQRDLLVSCNEQRVAKMDRERNPLGRLPDREESRFFFV